MNETKNWWESKTIWGAVVVVIAQLARLFFKIDITDAEQAQLIDALSTIASILGSALVAWGRVSATSTINPTKPPNQLGVILLCGSLFFTGCAGTFQIKNAQDAIALGYTTIKTVANAVTIAKQNQQITAQQRDRFVDKLQEAQDIINTANAALTKDPSSNTAMKSLQAAQVILQAIQQELLKAQNHANTRSDFRPVVFNSSGRGCWSQYGQFVAA